MWTKPIQGQNIKHRERPARKSYPMMFSIFYGPQLACRWSAYVRKSHIIRNNRHGSAILLPLKMRQSKTYEAEQL
jgi:hypothetical protein